MAITVGQMRPSEHPILVVGEPEGGGRRDGEAALPCVVSTALLPGGVFCVGAVRRGGGGGGGGLCLLLVSCQRDLSEGSVPLEESPRRLNPRTNALKNALHDSMPLGHGGQ